MLFTFFGDMSLKSGDIWFNLVINTFYSFFYFLKIKQSIYHAQSWLLFVHLKICPILYFGLLLHWEPGANFINILLGPVCTKEFCAVFLYLHFGSVIFWHKNFGAKAAFKCWWNWQQIQFEMKEYISKYLLQSNRLNVN